MTAEPIYILLLVVIVFLLYMIMMEREAQAAIVKPSVIQRVIDYPSYYGWWPSRFYGGQIGDVWLDQSYGPHHRPFWGPHIRPGHRYF